MRERIEDVVQEEFVPVLDKYISPLLDILSNTYNISAKTRKMNLPKAGEEYDPCADTIPFSKFMEKIGEASG